MALPMLGGAFALNAFNFTDTWFVALLGKKLESVIPLAAMGFTFMAEIHRYSGFLLNGIHKPFHATTLNVVKAFLFLIPFTLLGGFFSGNVTGVFVGRLAAEVLSGLLGVLVFFKVIKK